MTKEEMIENLGTVARSGTQRFMANLKDSNPVDLIGQFGVGFYSAYMVAEKVIVESTKAGTNETHIWESDGQEGYTVTKSSETLPCGTRITLLLKQDEHEFWKNIEYSIL